MKKILFLFISVAVLFSCKDPIVNKGVLDPNAMITIRPAKGVQLRSTVKDLTALEIVQQAVSIKYHSHYAGNVYEEVAKDIGRGFSEDMKDYETPALKMLGIDVISAEGEYYRDLTYADNVVITDINGDTIAYVPDDVIQAARINIEQAYNDENYTEVYRLFDEAFVFLPIE